MIAKNITIAIGNQKGGVGKTTSTACIGAALVLRGKRVLLVDLDAQQNLTFTLTQTKTRKQVSTTRWSKTNRCLSFPSVKTWTSFRLHWTWQEPK